jgi:hypothetical protein
MSNELIKKLREEIDRKHREAVQALETVAAYVIDSQITAPAAQAIQAAAAKKTTSIPAGKVKTVDVVLGAITSQAKTVEQLSVELGLPESKIRAVLYSKFVKPRVSRSTIGKKTGFRLKQVSSGGNQLGNANGDVSAASLVRAALASHPDGMAAGQVMAQISPDLDRMGLSKKAAGAALYNLKERGRATYNAQTGVYKLVASTEKTQA